jgi:hypothetical protein
MSGQEIVQRDHPQQVAGQLATLSTEQLKFIANTDFIPKSMRGNLPAILACVATGRALGLADMNALRSIHIIDGRATYSAELMVQLVRRAGHSITGKVNIAGASVTGKRFDTGDEMTFEFGPKDAELPEAPGVDVLGQGGVAAVPDAVRGRVHGRPGVHPGRGRTDTGGACQRGARRGSSAGRWHAGRHTADD